MNLEISTSTLQSRSQQAKDVKAAQARRLVEKEAGWVGRRASKVNLCLF